MSTTADGSQMFLKRDLRMSGDRRFFKCFIACVWSKKASVLLCIARSKRKQFNLKNRKEIQKSIGAKDLVKAKAGYKIDAQGLI